jgi:hypothetical protein
MIARLPKKPSRLFCNLVTKSRKSKYASQEEI